MQLTENINLLDSIKNVRQYLKKLNFFEKFLFYFWFLGPFLYLLERSPADIWLTFFSLVFLGRSLYLDDWSWIKIKWFQFAILLWVTTLISSVLGPMPIFTFGEGFFWIRFPLYAVATQYWLASNRDVRIIMLFVLILTLMIMSIILFAEAFFEPKERLTWPYGDLIPGSYLAKFCLPASCVLIAVAFSKLSRISALSGFYFLLTLFASFLTGERNNFIIRICSSIIALFSYQMDLKKYIYRTFIIILTLFLTLIFLVNNKSFKEEFRALNFVDKIPHLSFNNSYWGTWRSGIQQGIEKPLLGVGASGTRYTCGYLQDIKWLPGKNYCGNHPHNSYIQVFAETGIIGLIFFLFMVFYILRDCYNSRKINKNCVLACTAFIIPIAFFFPIQQSGSFFGQWNNLFMWFSIGFALSNFNIFEHKSIK